MNLPEQSQGLHELLPRLDTVSEQVKDDVLIVQLCTALREAVRRYLHQQKPAAEQSDQVVSEAVAQDSVVEEDPKTAEEFFMLCTGRASTNDLYDRVLLAYAEAKIRGEKSVSPVAIASRIGIDASLIYRQGWGINSEVQKLARQSGKYYLASARGSGYFLKRSGNHRKS